MRYSTSDNWAEFLKRTEGVDISGWAIRNRLKVAEKIGIDGRDKIGRLLKGSFYSEIDVRAVLSDLLMKPEEKKEKAIQALASHGITDRISLMAFGSGKFGKTVFLPFGKGIAFASAILGEPVGYITEQTFNLIADKLGFSEITVDDYKKILALHGITDRISLMVFGSKKFVETDFPPLGKGTGFASAILGETVNITEQIFNLIADKLGFSEITVDDYKKILALHGITDRISLMTFGLGKFKKTAFPPLGKGTGFASAILGEPVGCNMPEQTFNLIADKLGFSEITVDDYKKILALHGITDRISLMAFGTKKFLKTDFPPLGKGAGMAKAILGETVSPFKSNHLNRIADVLFGK